MNPRIRARTKRRNRRRERDRFLDRMRARMGDYDFLGCQQGVPVWRSQEPTSLGAYAFAFGWPGEPQTVTITRSTDPVAESAEVAL